MLQAIIEQYGIPAFGVSLVLTLVWLAGGRRNLRIDENRAREILQIEGLGAPASLVIADDGHVALAAPEGGDCPVLIRSHGDYWTTTPLHPADTNVSIDPDQPAVLRFRFSSAGQKNTCLPVLDAAIARQWLTRVTTADKGDI